MKLRNLNMALTKVMEELGETAQICSKIIFYGYDNVSPKRNDGKTNRNLLIEEMGDIIANFNVIIKDTEIGITWEEIMERADAKYVKLEGYIPEA